MCENIYSQDTLVHLYVMAPMCHKPQYLSVQSLCEVPAIIILTVIFGVVLIIIIFIIVVVICSIIVIFITITMFGTFSTTTLKNGIVKEKRIDRCLCRCSTSS